MMSRSLFLVDYLFLAVFFQCLGPCLCQSPSPQWTWGFPPSTSQFTECESLSVLVFPGDSYTPQPPFYMMAYEVNGPTTSSFLGSDPNSLSWQINHAAGAQLLLYVVDAGGVPGGVAGSVYTIQSGSTSSCHSTSSASPVEIRSAATTITTCNSLEFAFGGGTLPYTVTILVTNLSGPSVNLTLGPDDNEYTWIDMVDPAQAGVLLGS
ncbi:hypothetical protein SISSUDRAFT_1051199 [Sistotremastrum suecicum HHB10207 ss-3]|uniref:Ubiquitin 3 binding protein But2 C-terminal domain-containing protein n=1 Tax=Sistotremastrum suecicum HHB10207 ss-3 TaxID=1314776 RepID=A0A166AQ34_9AGAM|nr:hypothetical protein SISSUDRAFT_1051199 [Sistotremastrum suecicum HHB10207 ss-3]